MSCLICKEDLSEEPTVNVKHKGLQTLIKCSLIRQDDLDRVFREVNTLVLHKMCRKKYTYSKINAKGELRLLSLDDRARVTNKLAFASVNEDYTAYTNYLLSKDNENNTTSNSDPPENGQPIKIKEPHGSTENIDAPSNFPISYEPNSDIKYCPIEIQDGSLPQLQYYIPVVTGTSEPDSSLAEQKDPTVENQASNDDEIDPSKPFPFEHRCFLCAGDISEKYVQLEMKKSERKRNMVSRVKQQITKENIINTLAKANTLENQIILQRIQDVNLVEVNAGYHRRCMMKAGTKLSRSSRTSRGRPENPEITTAMETIYKYIDGTRKSDFTIHELMNLDENAPHSKTLVTRLKNKYSGRIYFTTVSGFSTVVTIVKDINIFDPNYDDVNENDCLIWKERNKERRRIKENKIKEKTKTEEEIIIEERRESRRLKDIEHKKKESMATMEENIKKDDERKRRSKRLKGVQKNKKESKQTLNTNIEDDGEVFFEDDYLPSPDEVEDVTSEQTASFNEIKEAMLICRICLSSDRKLDVLGEYRDMYLKICADIVPDDTKLFLVCWECRAVLVHATRFRARAETAHRLLMSQTQPNCLSTISISTPGTPIITYERETQELQSEKENSLEQTMDTNVTVTNLSRIEHSLETCIETNGNKDLNQSDDDIQRSPQAVTEDESNAFNDAWSDEEMDPPETKRPRRSVANKEKEAKVKEKAVEEDKESEETEDSSSQSSTSDEEWEASGRPASTKRKYDKKPAPPLRFRINILDYHEDSKIRREPLEEHELSNWLQSERDSTYFKLSKRNKCHKCISEVTNGEDHEKVYHSPSNPLVCHICKFTCSNADVLSSHVARHYFVLCCEMCSYKCYNELHMRSHVNWHRKTVQCLDCGGTFNSVEAFQQHFDEFHRKFICDYCEKEYPHKLYLETHIQRRHLPQVCTICKTKYSSYAQWKIHMDLKHRVDRTEAAYCVQCDIQFDNEKLLKRHVYHSVKHSSEWKRPPPKPKEKETHKCTQCPNVYRRASYLRDHHSLVHEKKVRFYCNQCDQAFPRKSNYQCHMRKKHEGYVYPKNKICHMCGRGFSVRRTLINHIRTHTGERPYACPYPHCDSKFAQKTAMRSHVKHVHEKTARRQTTAVATSEDMSFPEDIPF